MAFIHVPKSAGTSVSRSIYGEQVGHFTLERMIRNSQQDVLDLPRFAIVRNPWDRAVSAYHFARDGGSPGGGWMEHPERYRTEEFRNFDSFVHQYLATRDVRTLSIIFRPQCYYLSLGDGTTPLDHVGYLDRLTQTEDWLTRTLGRVVKFGQSNRTEHKDYRDYYDRDTRRVIAKVYGEDIEKFGFRF
ncbi:MULTISPECIES: sulfotransferase family 2 domain-containing protein [Mycobacteriaceae]